MESLGHIESKGAFVLIEADATSPKKSTNIVNSSETNVHPSKVTNTFTLSPLSSSLRPFPAVAVTVLEAPPSPQAASFNKN